MIKNIIEKLTKTIEEWERIGRRKYRSIEYKRGWNDAIFCIRDSLDNLTIGDKDNESL